MNRASTTSVDPCDVRKGDPFEAMCRSCPHAVMAHRWTDKVCSICDVVAEFATAREILGRYQFSENGEYNDDVLDWCEKYDAARRGEPT